MEEINKKSPLSRYAAHWFPCAVAALLSLTLYLGIWPLVFHLIILPGAVPGKHGLQVNFFDRMESKGKPSDSSFNSSDKLTLKNPETSLSAYGLWKVPQSGRYRIRMACDDFGSLNLDGQDLIRLAGINALNIGEAEVELKDGYHLLVLHLVNGPGQGWLSLTTVSPQNNSLLGGSSLVYLELANFYTWFKVARVVKKGSLLLLVFFLGALTLLTFVRSGGSLKEIQARWKMASCIRYLKSPTRQFGLPIALILIFIYDIVTKSNPQVYSLWIVLLTLITLILALFRGPRWIIYVFLFIALTVHIFVFVNILSKGDQDPGSTRDEAVEIAAKATLNGENAWNKDVGAPITTGPTSILLALPFVFLLGEINWLTFIFWMVFYLVLLRNDLIYQNQSWPILVLFLILGYFGFEHTLYWSLDELYYPFLFLALAYFLINRGSFLVVGILMAAVLLSRFSYFFMIMGFGFWYFFSFPFNGHHIFKMGAGFVLGAVVILLPFVIIGGKDFWDNNFLILAYHISGAPWPDNNFFFRLLNELDGQIGPEAMRWVKLGLTVSFMAPLSWGLRILKVPHPFWHITCGAFLAHTIVWLPAHLPMDYALIFVLPAMLAISNSPTEEREAWA